MSAHEKCTQNKANRIPTIHELEELVNKWIRLKNDQLIRCGKRVVLETLKVNDYSVYLTSLCNKSYVLEQNTLIGKEYTVDPNIDYSKVPVNGLYIPKMSNELLEFRGDSVIASVIVNYISDRYSYTNEGFLTPLKIKLIRTDSLYNFSKSCGLIDFLLISTNLEHHSNPLQNRNSKKLNENAFEAFIGAIMVDNPKTGYNVCRNFIVSLIENTVNLGEVIRTNINPKGSIIKWFKKNPAAHEFVTPLEKGETNNRKFYSVFIVDFKFIETHPQMDKILVYHASFIKNFLGSFDTDALKKFLRKDIVNYIIVGGGVADSKVDSEQVAARYAMCNLRIPENY